VIWNFNNKFSFHSFIFWNFICAFICDIMMMKSEAAVKKEFELLNQLKPGLKVVDFFSIMYSLSIRNIL